MPRRLNNPQLFKLMRVVLSDGSTYTKRGMYPYRFFKSHLDERNNPAWATSSMDDLDDENYRKKREQELLLKERANTLKFTAKISRGGSKSKKR